MGVIEKISKSMGRAVIMTLVSVFSVANEKAFAISEATKPCAKQKVERCLTSPSKVTKNDLDRKKVEKSGEESVKTEPLPISKNFYEFLTDKTTTQEEVRHNVAETVDLNWQRGMPTVEMDFHDTVASSALPKETGNEPCADHLETILSETMIPKLKVVNAPLTQVLETIEHITEHLNVSMGGEKGINLVKMPSKLSQQDPLISLSLRSISLEHLLDMVAKASGYHYDILPDAVVFFPPDAVSDMLVTQKFPVSRATVARIVGDTGLASENPGESRLNLRKEAQAILNFLRHAGVKFDEEAGAALAFDGSQMMVTNTYRQIRKVKTIIDGYSDVHQVAIEARFIEVQDGVLDELGFRWQLGTRDGTGKIFFQTGNGGNDNLRTLSQAFSQSNFSSGNGQILTSSGQSISVPNQAPGMPGQIALGASGSPLSSFTGVINNAQVGMMLRALEQHTGADLMSAPKVTVLSGRTANIVVATELRYPQSYGDTRSEVGTGSSTVLGSTSAGVTITAGTPKDFTTRNVGVEMLVTPTVEADGTISLLLSPKVTEFEGFVEYGGANVAVSSSTTVTVPTGFYQPIFSTRKIETEVNIQDGATVMMGGLTRDEVKEVHDKVPLIGDIPLLGRLFQSKSETTQKRNLLIFVTAHTIHPDGSSDYQKTTQETWLKQREDHAAQLEQQKERRQRKRR